MTGRAKTGDHAAPGEEPQAAKKHSCPDCTFCQWCSDDRCRLCLDKNCSGRKKLSIAEQIALYESLQQKSWGSD